MRDLAVPASDAAEVYAAANAARKAGKSRPAVLAAIDIVRSSASLSIAHGLAAERQVLQHLRVSREAFALRHQFFAECDAAKVPSLVGAKPRELARADGPGWRRGDLSALLAG